MSEQLQAEFRDHVLNANKNSKLSALPASMTDKLHTAFRCAEQKEPSKEDIKTMAAALGCILRDTERRGTTRSDIVVAQEKPKKR
jgi:hypothetical protein